MKSKQSVRQSEMWRTFCFHSASFLPCLFFGGAQLAAVVTQNCLLPTRIATAYFRFLSLYRVYIPH